MCFSAAASFAGGAVLSAVGVATVRKTVRPAQLSFASVPLIFGVQQLSEGFVWLSLQSPGHESLLNISTYIFLITAVVIWPVMIPFSIFRLEGSERKRKALTVLFGAGIITSLYYGIGLMIFSVDPEIVSHHISYTNDFPKSLALPVFFLYLSATLMPFFISGVRKMYLLGILMTVSCFITGFFFREYLTSVWCFFAALISVFIWWIINDSRKG